MTTPGQPIPYTVESLLERDGPLPLVVRPAGSATSLAEFASRHRAAIRDKLLVHGGILFRGFPDASPETFREFITLVSGSPLEYQERSSPRHEVHHRIYTSTDYPPDESIFLHNEQSYNITWPLRIFFFCVVPPAGGGATPIADCRRVYRRISEQTRRRFEEHGYSYVRNFREGLGISWRYAFQTDRRDVVENYCRANDISFHWGPADALSTRQVRPAVARHPESGELTWFNHATFFNVRTLQDDEVAEALLCLGRDSLPNNTYYADGAEIEDEVIAELRAAYAAETVIFPWRQGDILMLDNMLTAHGREPFSPPREIVVGMAEPVSGR